jgi:vancomycin resistance protein YoaR
MNSPISRRKADTNRAWFAVVIGLGFLVALSALALADAIAGRDRVQRGVQIAGEPVGRMNEAELDSFLEKLDGRYRRLQIGVSPPDGGFELSGADLGITVEAERLRAQVLDEGHSGGAVSRIGSYFGSLFGSKDFAVPIRVDAEAVTGAIRTADVNGTEQATDPTLVVEGDRFVIKPGKPGRGVSGAAVAATLEQRLVSGPNDLIIPVERVTLASRYTEQELQALLGQAERLTAKPLPIEIGDKGITLQPKQLRRWVTPTIVGDTVSLKLDGEAVLEAIKKGVGKVGKPAKNARLQVNNDGTVTAVPAEVGLICCSDDSVERLNQALAAATGETVRLDLQEVQPKVRTEQVTALGVKELVGSFTTKHAPGEVRVKNIHHIADELRGIVIQPGDTFSVNQTIGPRTAANGFFKAKVIEDGVYAENFGGGISQFATTMFNAAFFAGLDLVEYQSHSLYISRYPYGREATLSFPDPDLKIRNNTPYGVLIWPTYTSRSITVNFYSTRFVKGEVIRQEVQERQLCKVVYTYRRRTYVSGKTENDRTRAMYRPAEGIDCKGNPTAGATTTVAKPRTTKRSSGSEDPPETRADSGSDDSGRDSTPATKKPVVTAGGGNSGDGGNSSDDDTPETPETTKATKARPKATRPAPEPEPQPTTPPPPDDGGGVGVGGPPVTGLG